MTGARGTAAIRDMLAARRRDAFVGRASEREMFLAALLTGELPFHVLYVHGPGGVGKTTLLEAFAVDAVGAAAMVVRIDGRLPGTSLESIRDELLAAVDASEDAAKRLVVLVDGYERLALLDECFRNELVPTLPPGTLTVLASRRPPTPDWRVDPGWTGLARIISLRNLEASACSGLLERRGIDRCWHDRLIDASHGHPLALTLLADLVARGGDVNVDPLAPDVVATLLGRLLDVVPQPAQQRALAVCAVARVTTEGLLRDVVGDQAHELFEWLRQLSFVDTTREGLMPHELARDVLDVDLRWRDPDQYREVFRAVRAHIHRRLHGLRGVEQQRAIADEKFVFRNLPSVLSPVDWETWGELFPEPADAAAREAIVELVRHHEGAESASIAMRWARLQPDAFFVVPGSGGSVVGGLVHLRLPDPAEVAFDPAAQAAWTHVLASAPPRPGECVTQTRFVVDRARYQAPSPTLNATPILTLQRYLNLPTLAWDFLTLADPDPLDAYFELAGLSRVAGADFTIGGRTFGLFAHDFRRLPVDEWLELITERALAQGPHLSITPAKGELLVLSSDEFVAAVRQGLRDLHRPDLLARNPLRRTRVVSEAGADRPPGEDVVADVLAAAVDRLRDDPRNHKRWRAVERTYVRPAPTQERAAEVLGVPFSSYRRHLTEGVSQVVAALWERELYGA